MTIQVSAEHIAHALLALDHCVELYPSDTSSAAAAKALRAALLLAGCKECAL